MNAITQRYLDECRAPGSGLTEAMLGADLPPAYEECWGGRYLPRPFFAQENEISDLAANLVAFFDLLTSLPTRLFDGDVVAYCDALGMKRTRSALLREYARIPSTVYGRADLYRDEHSFRLLEFNVASDLGGIDCGELNRGLLAVPSFQRFAEAHRLSSVDTAEKIVCALRAAAPGQDPVVAIVCADEDLAKYRRLLESSAQSMRRFGVHVLVCGLGEVTNRGGKLFLGATRVDVVLRYFTIDHVVGDEHLVEPILRAQENGNAVLWTSMDSSLYSNKGALSLLSDPRGLEVLSTDEIRLVDELLPWTRLLTPDLLDHLVEHREQIILKPRKDFGGSGIVVGWETSEQVWKDALSACVEQDYIAQRRVVPVPEFVVDPVSREAEQWMAAWGVFVTPDGYAGTVIRALPADGGAVVNFADNPATRITSLFTG